MWRQENDFNDHLYEKLPKELELYIGITLYPKERESFCKGMRIDILAEDILGNYVVIETVYGRADNDHLGKLIRYFNNRAAKFAILIAEDIDEDMLLTMRDLNRVYAQDERGFFAIKLRCLRVEEKIRFLSPWNDHQYEVVERPAFNIDEKYKRELQNPEKNKKVKFLRGLLEVSNLKSPMFKNAKIAKGKGYVKARVKPGIAWRYIVEKDTATIALGFFLKRNEEDYKLNNERYNILKQYQEEINLKFINLEWRDGGTPSIAYSMPGVLEVRKWPQIFSVLTDAFLDMYNLLNPYISQIP